MQKAEKCVGMKGACVFVGRDDGWLQIDEDSTTSPKPYPPISDSWSKSDTSLFLSIASFRDKLCPRTLYNAFTKATHPERITIGVVQQNEDVDPDCLEQYCVLARSDELFISKFNHLKGSRDENFCPFEKNVRMHRVQAGKAKGPTWARALGSKLLEQEEFCMQTDAHMDFVPNWDTLMMQMWSLTENEYAVLSTYVAAIETLKDQLPGEKGTNKLFEVPHLCMVTLNGMGNMVRNWGTKAIRMANKPKMTNMIWGAGLSFSKCHAERKVPYDPHTPFIFDGEEFSRALRFWTYGYDIYSPHRVYVVHDYTKSQSDPTHSAWFANSGDLQEGSQMDSLIRLRTLHGMPYGEEDSGNIT